MNTDQRAIQHLNRVLPVSRFDFGAYLSEGLSLWKKEFGPYVGFGILFLIISMVVGVIPFIGSLVNNLFVTPALTVGAYIFSHNIYKKHTNPDFGQFFDGFKLAGEIIIANLIYYLALIILMAPFLIASGGEFMNWIGADPVDIADRLPELFTSWKLALLIIPLAGALLFTYAMHFIVFYKLKAIDAVKYSVKFTMKHYFPILFLIIVSVLIMLLGLLGLFIGIFITISVMFPISYSSFKGMTQLDAYENEDAEQNVHDALIF